MTSPIVVRRAASDEGEEIGLLTLAAYRGDRVVDEEYAKELGDGTARVRDAHVLVAFAGLRMVGSVTLAESGTPFAEIAEPGELEVRMLGVDPAARRLGIADRLMDAAEQRARDRSLAGVVLSTAPHMTAAHALYERRGYLPQPQRNWHVDDDLLLLAYRLAL
mgnify:CR=1 FL=1